jgi:hypothetical protein
MAGLRRLAEIVGALSHAHDMMVWRIARIFSVDRRWTCAVSLAKSTFILDVHIVSGPSENDPSTKEYSDDDTENASCARSAGAGLECFWVDAGKKQDRAAVHVYHG